MKNKILDYFFKQAEQGNWENISLDKASKKLNLDLASLKQKVPSKNHFLVYYNQEVDKLVMNSISDEEILDVRTEEIILELFMIKLEIMNRNKLAISNIINESFKDPLFTIINLKNTKKSINSFLKKANIKTSTIRQSILVKLLLLSWIMAYRKWLYEGEDNSKSNSILDKSIKKIQKNTSLFD